MAKRMTQQTREMVEYVNSYLRIHQVKSEDDPTFNLMGTLLLKADCYHGFNYFTKDRKHSGGVNENFHHLEYYIK